MQQCEFIFVFVWPVKALFFFSLHEITPRLIQYLSAVNEAWNSILNKSRPVATGKNKWQYQKSVETTSSTALQSTTIIENNDISISGKILDTVNIPSAPDEETMFKVSLHFNHVPF
jgi:hypothetical protein